MILMQPLWNVEIFNRDAYMRHVLGKEGICRICTPLLF